MGTDGALPSVAPPAVSGASDRFGGRVALVTGGASGIGPACARLMGTRGARVAVLNREGPAVEAAAAELGALPLVAAVARLDAEKGRLDVLVASAAFQPHGTVEETDDATWARAVAVNLGGVRLAAALAVPRMRAAGGGAIVTISSVQGVTNQAGVAAYVATEGAVHALTRALALDHAADGSGPTPSTPAPCARRWWRPRPRACRTPRPGAGR